MEKLFINSSELLEDAFKIPQHAPFLSYTSFAAPHQAHDGLMLNFIAKHVKYQYVFIVKWLDRTLVEKWVRIN